MPDTRSLDGLVSLAPGVVGPSPTPGKRKELRAEQSAISERQMRERGGAAHESAVAAGPMVVRTADLVLTSKEFDQSRSLIEEILKRHKGYLGNLNVSETAGSARTLTATLRVPADQLDTTIAELKNLGRVESESQKGEEVSQQYVDLQARLLNARNSEQR